ncbi:MOSC domain-containing protein [Shewanella algidipiscicola]|uniref:Molybdenum cofactor biosynthesis protein n=1 Tax=Shewanella algidipiscicola TaxID=614070 RepID=A0ABQ4PBC3_9GAMM|nr:MOSC domain-containing protein [Shewanella algidipiscicola]GIU44870.1 molybdenum cofactor biosynthesis protein [Shewanella algidipiscicola]
MASLQGISYKVVKRGPMLETSTALVTTSSGVAQDIFGKPGNRQVTVLSFEQWEQACESLNTQLPWTTRRANLLVEGVRFGPQDVGKIMHVGDLQLLVTGETDPCRKMQAAFPGLEKALTPDWRGGITCKVLNDATIDIGNRVYFSEQLQLL